MLPYQRHAERERCKLPPWLPRLKLRAFPRGEGTRPSRRKPRLWLLRPAFPVRCGGLVTSTLARQPWLSRRPSCPCLNRELFRRWPGERWAVLVLRSFRHHLLFKVLEHFLEGGRVCWLVPVRRSFLQPRHYAARATLPEVHAAAGSPAVVRRLLVPRHPYRVRGAVPAVAGWARCLAGWKQLRRRLP